MRRLFLHALPLILAMQVPLMRGTLVLAGQDPPRVQAAEIKGYVYAENGFLQPLDASSPAFTSNFDAQGLGGFGWQFTNSTGRALNNLRFVVFLDADIDREANTFFNEHGSLGGLRLPAGAPVGAIAASSWEIDEPGFLFGDIAQHLLDGVLDNANSVPAGDVNDVSLALGFQGGTLLPGASVVFSFEISRADIGGLTQTDPDSNFTFYFNGYAKPLSAPPAIVTTPVTRQQGSPGTSSSLASVSDDLTPAGNLNVVATAVPQGISIVGLTNNNGTIGAIVAAACTARLGANAVGLQVTDGEGQTSTGELIVNVVANSPPSPGSYPALVRAPLGGDLSVAPIVQPSDNGTITSISAAAPGFAGSLNADTASGVIAIGQAGPLGTYAVTVRVTDNCGEFSETVFRVEVVKAADLAVAIGDTPDPVGVGENLTYEIEIANHGPSDATNVSLQNWLPEYVNLISATPATGSCAQSNRVVTCNIGNLAAGNSTRLTLIVKTLSAGSIVDTAAVMADEVDPWPANNTARQTTVVTACGLSLSAPALTRGFDRTGSLPDGDWFTLPERFRLSVVSQPFDTTTFAVDPAGFGDGFDSLRGLRLEGLRFARQNTTTRVVSCEERLNVLSIALAANGNTTDDTVRLFLQTPGGTVVQQLALFTLQAGGAVVTQLNPHLTLHLNNRLASGPGALTVGEFIPLNTPAGSAGARSGLLTLTFSNAAGSPLDNCYQLGIDVKRGAGTGTLSVVIAEAVTDRHERPGDRLNPGSGLIGGLGGGYPTGMPCDGACPTCSARECIANCFRSPQYYLFNLDRLVTGNDLGVQTVIVGGINNNRPMGVRVNLGVIKWALRDRPFGLTTPLSRLNQGYVAAQLSFKPAALGALFGRLSCYSRLAGFGPVRLSNGAVLTPDSLLTELFEQALSAIEENRYVDMDPLAGVFRLLNGTDPQGRCN